MPAFLQLSTVDKILSLLSSAVLAVVVIHTPLIALASQTGVGGGFGGVVVPPVVEPPLFFLQDPNPTINVVKKIARVKVRICFFAIDLYKVFFKGFDLFLKIINKSIWVNKNYDKRITLTYAIALA